MARTGKSTLLGRTEKIVVPADWGPFEMQLESADNGMARVFVARDDGQEPFFEPFRDGFRLTLTPQGV
jgi:hypothetical protein